MCLAHFDKYIVKSKSCSFFGKIYTVQGVKPDPKKVEAIKEMHAPSTKEELHSLLGMINYLIQFIPSMSELTSFLGNSWVKIFFSNGQIAMRKNFRNWKAESTVMPAYSTLTQPNQWHYK